MLHAIGWWLATWKDAIIPLGVVVAGAAFVFNVAIEALRWRSRLSAMYHGSAAVVGGPARPLPFVIEGGASASTPDRDRHVVLLRNESHRPTAILDVVPLTLNREPIQPVKYRHKSGLPVVVPAWGLVKTFVYLDQEDEANVAWLRFRDMHDKELDVRVKVSSMPPKWVKPTRIGGNCYDDQAPGAPS